MKGCLLIHGFTGSPYEVLPLAKHLQQQNPDWRIHTPILPGHGGNGSLKTVTREDWIREAEKELLLMSSRYEQIDVVGYSMGGLIASYLAAKYPINRLVLLSAAVYYMSTNQLLKEVSDMLKEYRHDQQAVAYSIQKYKLKMSHTPIRAVFQFKKLVKELTPMIEHIDVPILIVQGEKDHLVEPSSAIYIYNKVKSEQKELLLLRESKHNLCYDCEKEILFNRVHQFLEEPSYVY